MLTGALSLGCALSSLFLGQAQSQPAASPASQEWFIQSARFNCGGTGRDITPCEHLLRYRFETGKTEILEDHDPKSRDRRSRVVLMDAHGRPLQVRVEGKPGTDSERLTGATNPAGSPAVVLQNLRPARMEPAAVSPDGKWLVFFDPSKQELVMGGTDKIYRVPTTWWLSRPFAWAPDSTQVAFYYAADMEQDDVHVQKHGVAVLGTDGRLRDLVKPDEVGTKHSDSKDIPIGWDAATGKIYYTAGLAADDPMRDAQTLWPTVTSRVDVETGRVEKVAAGNFTDISPDGGYLIVTRFWAETVGGRIRTKTLKVDSNSLEQTELPAIVLYPRLSPSGKLAAVFMPKNSIACLRTSDWTQVGKPVPMPADGLSLEAWGNDFRWITVGPDGWKPD